MYLKSLSIYNFKNFEELNIALSSGINCFTGLNGEGKTNLLDAIHYLSFCKSFLVSSDVLNIRFNEAYFAVQGTFVANNSKEDIIYCAVKPGERKVFKKNQKEYSKLADHIGNFPLVIISPLDSNLITEGSDERRRFLDSIISQYSKEYLEKLIQYNKVLLQRNALLKQFAENGSFNYSVLEIWDAQLGPLGDFIYKERKEFLEKFIPVFHQYFEIISNKKEEVGIHYISQLNQALKMEDLLSSAINKDRAAQYTTVGIHKDDLDFLIKDFALKKHASQGQQKSFLIALKLAQFEFLKQKKGEAPLLLLDDIFDKLDDTRIARLIELVSKEGFGQVFITDTQKERIQHILEKANAAANIYSILAGNLIMQ
jgi:DNA replication and repair protein RecF